MSKRIEKGRGGTDWTVVDALTDEDLHAAAAADPDNPPLTEEQFRRFRPVPFARRVRCRLGLSQAGFAKRFGIPIKTIRAWEQGQRMPGAASRLLLHVIELEPRIVAKAAEKAQEEAKA